MGEAIRALDSRQSGGPAQATPLSSLAGPIEDLSFLRASLLFAELSKISYMSRSDAGMWAFKTGLPEVRFYDFDGAQAYILGNDHDAVVVCRGTEPHDWNDWRANIDIATVLAETAGRVHRGFKREVDDLWPRLERALISNRRALWFAGHSLGGAMSTICAGRCRLSHIRSNPRALFTYGAPRIGNSRYVNFVKLEFYRWVNNNDLVPRVPPATWGYRHTGLELYLDSRGRLRRLPGWRRAVDSVRGIVGSLRQRDFDPVADHSLNEYIKHIARAAEEHENDQRSLILPDVVFQPPPTIHQFPAPTTVTRGASPRRHAA